MGYGLPLRKVFIQVISPHVESIKINAFGKSVMLTLLTQDRNLVFLKSFFN